MIWLVNAAFVAKLRSNRFDPGANVPNSGQRDLNRLLTIHAANSAYR
jgi:hypothetical protein